MNVISKTSATLLFLPLLYLHVNETSDGLTAVNHGYECLADSVTSSEITVIMRDEWLAAWVDPKVAVDRKNDHQVKYLSRTRVLMKAILAVL